MYYCNNCKSEFENPLKEKHCFEKYFKVNNLFNSTHYFDLLKCPNCNSDDIEKMRECDYCGEWTKEDDLVDTEEMIGGGCGWYCPQCIQDCDINYI